MSAPEPQLVNLKAGYQRGRLWSLLRRDEQLASAANLLLDPDVCRYRVRDDDGGPVVDVEVRFPTIGWAVVATWELDAFTGSDLETILDALVEIVDVPDDVGDLL